MAYCVDSLCVCGIAIYIRLDKDGGFFMVDIQIVMNERVVNPISQV